MGAPSYALADKKAVDGRNFRNKVPNVPNTRQNPRRTFCNSRQPSSLLVAHLEVDDDLAVHVPFGLELDRLADLFDREAGRDRYEDLVCCSEASDLFQGTRGRVGAIGGSDSLDLDGDGGDALVGDSELPCGVDGVGPVKIDRSGDAVGSEETDPVGQPVAVGDGLGPPAA
jgi:hypothetical protein